MSSCVGVGGGWMDIGGKHSNQIRVLSSRREMNSYCTGNQQCLLQARTKDIYLLFFPNLPPPSCADM